MCAPPIRGGGNREALWRALAEGILDLVASDHSPCTPGLKALDSGSLVWVKVKESGEEFARVDGPCVFTREAITRCMFTQKYAGMDFDLNDSDVPKSDDAKLAWEDGDGTEIRIHHVRLVPYFYVETRKTS